MIRIKYTKQHTNKRYDVLHGLEVKETLLFLLQFRKTHLWYGCLATFVARTTIATRCSVSSLGSRLPINYQRSSPDEFFQFLFVIKLINCINYKQDYILVWTVRASDVFIVGCRGWQKRTVTEFETWKRKNEKTPGIKTRSALDTRS